MTGVDASSVLVGVMTGTCAEQLMLALHSCMTYLHPVYLCLCSFPCKYVCKCLRTEALHVLGVHIARFNLAMQVGFDILSCNGPAVVWLLWHHVMVAPLTASIVDFFLECRPSTSKCLLSLD